MYKSLLLAPAVQGTTQLGYPAPSVLWIGIIELGCVVLHLVPRTSVLGALLLTGYLGGAVATQLRVGAPLPSHTLFPIYVAALLWGGLMSFQAYLDNIKAKTGKTPANFKALAVRARVYRKDMKAGDLVAWLKKEFGLGHGHAMAIWAVFKQRGWV